MVNRPLADVAALCANPGCWTSRKICITTENISSPHKIFFRLVKVWFISAAGAERSACQRRSLTPSVIQETKKSPNAPHEIDPCAGRLSPPMLFSARNIPVLSRSRLQKPAVICILWIQIKKKRRINK